MNKHFKDAWYYLKRAGEEGRIGVTETVSPIERDLRTRLGLEAAEPKSEQTRGKRLKSEFETLRGRAKRLLRRARDRKERTA